MCLSRKRTNVRIISGLLFAGFLCAVISSGTAKVGTASPKYWKRYENSTIYNIPGGKAYAYVTDFMTIDADGAPNAYHPEDTGLDLLKHAGYPHTSWWKDVLVTDPAHPDRPFVMSSGTYTGYYLSMTALSDPRKSCTDPACYVDATSVPYLVFPEQFSIIEGVGALGDIGMAINLSTGKMAPFVVADIGPGNHPLGEVSIRLAEMLGGGKVSARTGPEKPLGRILYIVFPGTRQRHPWPQSTESIESIASENLARIGGLKTVLASVGSSSGR
jgi:hypothetical protein